MDCHTAWEAIFICIAGFAQEQQATHTSDTLLTSATVAATLVLLVIITIIIVIILRKKRRYNGKATSEEQVEPTIVDEAAVNMNVYDNMVLLLFHDIS